MGKGKLYLIPAGLSETEMVSAIPPQVREVINTIDEYIAENERSARRYLKLLGIAKPIQELVFHVLNEHTDRRNIGVFLASLDLGKNIGVITEAGCPGVADPGADIVALAHEKDIPVVPLVGPSSILLALMASGLNGQRFVFHGYLPLEKNEKIRALLNLEKQAQQLDQTQIFMETPYRNNHLLQDILQNCQGTTRLCIAADLTLPTEFIKTKTVALWKKGPCPDLNKRPAIFLIYK